MKMISNISFGSIFNPERVGRRNIEDGQVNPEHNLERLNAHQEPHEFGKVGEVPVEHMDFGEVGSVPLELFINPEENIETLKYGQEIEPSKSFPVLPQESLGRSQVRILQNPKPIELNSEDKEILSKLSSKKYGFHGNSNGFWIHFNNQNKDGTCSITMGDGKLQDGTTRADFIKGLLKDNVQAFNVAGINKDGEKIMTTIVYNKETDTTTFYSSNCDETREEVLEFGGYEGFRTFVDMSIDELDIINGATIWQ